VKCAAAQAVRPKPLGISRGSVQKGSKRVEKIIRA
jgi:hypothetical protein